MNNNPTAKPNLPPVPPVKAPEDPSWWNLGAVPFFVLLMVAAAADLAWPREYGFGIGAGLGCFLAINALLLLRKDLSRGEYWFLQALAILNCLVLIMCGNPICWFSSLVLPFIVVMLPTKNNMTQPNTSYRNWWSFWVAKRPEKKATKGRFAALRAILPLLICILIGLVCFVAFLCIFAAGNPVVEIVWNTLVEWWNKLVEFLHISWDFWLHVLFWIVGFLWFGIYCFRRPSSSTPLQTTTAPEQAAPTGTTMLPYLPLCVLLGVNAAFLVATSTDIAYLWFGNVPEGISQTTYLHEGAESITWASVLAAGLLVLLYRQRGVARTSAVSRVLGYVLVIQTALLAVSVYMRLYYQISDFGFTTRRIEAAECMLLGLIGLVVLVIYMSTNGAFWKYTKICLGAVLLACITFAAYSPARMAGTLNMMYVGTHPHWKFKCSDFSIGRFDEKENLAFAEYVFNHSTPEDRESTSKFFSSVLTKDELVRAALDVELRATQGSWINYTFSLQQDIPAAERILGRPIKVKFVDSED